MSNTRGENQSGESSDKEVCEQDKRKDVTERKMFKCVICSKQYKTLKTLKQHIQRMYGKENVKSVRNHLRNWKNYCKRCTEYIKKRNQN